MTAPARPKRARPAIELRSGSVTVPVLRLLTADVEPVAEQLAEKIDQAPEFFRNAPMMIELSGLGGNDVDFPALLSKLRALGVQPIGVRGGGEDLQRTAQAAGLVVFEGRSEPQAVCSAATASAPAEAEPKSKPEPPQADAQSAEKRSRTITQPIRSGQRVYAQKGDLIVLATVSAGAEVIADGNIHVYGTLRGRALAGVNGDTSCRIFCQDLQAELVSVAGNYRISENLDDSIRGKAVQIYLQGESLIVEEL